MKIYATLDKNGQYNGFYQDNIHKVIPDGAVEITEKQRADFLHAQANPNYTPTEADLALQELALTDNLMPRALEDLYDILLQSGKIALSDIPESVAELREKRKNARAKITSN